MSSSATSKTSCNKAPSLVRCSLSVRSRRRPNWLGRSSTEPIIAATELLRTSPFAALRRGDGATAPGSMAEPATAYSISAVVEVVPPDFVKFGQHCRHRLLEQCPKFKTSGRSSQTRPRCESTCIASCFHSDTSIRPTVRKSRVRWVADFSSASSV